MPVTAYGDTKQTIKYLYLGSPEYLAFLVKKKVKWLKSYRKVTDLFFFLPINGLLILLGLIVLLLYTPLIWFAFILTHFAHSIVH